MDIELASLHALRSLHHIGDKTLRLLVAHFGSGQTAWEHTGSFADIPDLSQKAVLSLTKRDLSQRETLFRELTDSTIQILHEDDPLYPKLLREIPDHPLILYVRGNFDWSSLEHKPLVAIVGSRKFTPYGEQVALRLSHDLAEAGVIVVSGLAFGIDKKAHEGSLDASGETFAVLGGGLIDKDIAPRSHVTLAEKIMKSGALISEYPPHTEIMPGNFPARNRIIAGLIQGIIVIEAAEKSGSLITATLALEYNRDVFAVPGSIFSPVSQGTHALIKRGAKLVTHVQDILEELRLVTDTVTDNSTRPLLELNETEQLIFTKLSHDHQEIRSLLQATTLPIGELQATLTLLEIKGLVHHTPGLGYRKTHTH